MKRSMFRNAFARVTIVLATVGLSLSATASVQIQKSTKDALNYLKTVYETTYAPADWKKEFDSWDITEQFTSATAQTEKKGTQLSVLEGRRILMDFVYSMRDYHVSIRFVSTAESTLPLTIRSAEGKYFIVYVDKTRLDPKLFPFQVGDEVIEFDGRPVADVVRDLRANIEENVAETDQALAELNLTTRRMARGVLPAQGPVVITAKSKADGAVYSRQIIWDTKAEEIPTFPENESKLKSVVAKSDKSIVRHFEMSAQKDLISENPHGLGARNSYLPKLGETIWESDENDYFQAYIYRAENSKMLGVIRIRSYVVNGGGYDKAVVSFSKIVNRMEKFTDGLIIDQLNNPGGSVFYLYALASTLSPKPLQTPRHTMSITPTEVSECVQTIKQMNGIQTDEDARKLVGENIHGYPVSLQFVQFYKSYCQTYIEDWNKGFKMSRPYWIAGVDQINPYPQGTYSKPIMILVNELDFSGGDFFPTIMQDNQRAKIFGVRTAGAGGYVNDITFPNLLGVDVFRVTQSLAYRVSQRPIENLGVTPDVAYTLKTSDRTNNYADYVKAVKETMNGLIK
jgi:hypothetical protein